MSTSSPPPTQRAIEAITNSRPPLTDDLTYLTIVESHLSPEVLPTLNDVLQDVELTQRIGWDLIHMLIPLPGAETCLKTIARLGNPREVILQVTEALRLLVLDDTSKADHDVTEEKSESVDKAETVEKAGGESDKPPKSKETAKPTETDKFCLLVSMLATLHPRIKTKYPSRFFSTSLMAILSSYRPSNQATYAVTAFAHALSGQKRPPLPTRKSSLSMHNLSIGSGEKDEQAPDPEASAEDPQEEAIQKKLLQSFVTYILELYVKENSLEWAARLQEHFAPEKVVPGKRSFGEAYREDPELQEREVVVGQIVALARDLGLDGAEYLLSTPDQDLPTPPNELSDIEDFSPTSPDQIPLSQSGSLFLIASTVFSSLKFSNTNVSLPSLTIFPSLAFFAQLFIGKNGIETAGTENPSVIDALLAIGLWLEHADKFVAGPLDDDDFLQLLQTLSLVSANCPRPALRHAAHILTTNILHAHPTDRVRLTFISDTLEHCPFETLRASAVAWLKEELILARERGRDASSSIFASPAALTAVQPFLFPYESAMLAEAPAELWDDFRHAYPFHMAALNFIFFLNSGLYASVVPEGCMTVVEEVYLGPLRAARVRLEEALQGNSELARELGEVEAEEALREVQLLGQRLDMCVE